VEYNFGIVGLIVVPIALAVINHALIVRFCAQSQRDNLEVIGFSGLFVVLGTWVAGAPDYLFNAGLGAYILLIYLGGKRRAKWTSESVVSPR